MAGPDSLPLLLQSQIPHPVIGVAPFEVGTGSAEDGPHVPELEFRLPLLRPFHLRDNEVFSGRQIQLETKGRRASGRANSEMLNRRFFRMMKSTFQPDSGSRALNCPSWAVASLAAAKDT